MFWGLGGSENSGVEGRGDGVGLSSGIAEGVIVTRFRLTWVSVGLDSVLSVLDDQGWEWVWRQRSTGILTVKFEPQKIRREERRINPFLNYTCKELPGMISSSFMD